MRTSFSVRGFAEPSPAMAKQKSATRTRTGQPKERLRREGLLFMVEVFLSIEWDGIL
jgi:hypothetical protein